VTPEQQKQWLLQRAEVCGFNLTEDGFNVVHTQRLGFQKGKSRDRVTINTAVFEGHLTITDLERFRHTLLRGIGRAKAYGCGLLTIARPYGIT
jgi:CRISPR system Cascade subunit CasE